MLRLLPLLCLGFSYCSMQYFMLITRLIGELTGDLALWSAIGSGCFLCALGLGVLLAERYQTEKLSLKVSEVEILIALLGPASLLGIHVWNILYRIYIFDNGVLKQLELMPTIYAFAIFAQVPLLLLGFLSGLEVGLINRICLQQSLRRVQLLLAIYHLGGLLATLGLLLVLIPQFEIMSIGIATGLLNLILVAIWIRFNTQSQKESPTRALALGFCTIGLIALFLSVSDLVEVQRKNFYYNTHRWSIDINGRMKTDFPFSLLEWWDRSDSYPPIERFTGLYQNIDFVRPHESSYITRPKPQHDEWFMFMDYRFQVNSVTERSYHEAMAHVPSALRGTHGGKILVIGGGDGLLVREILRADHVYNDKRLETIDLIDIDKTILKLAQEKPELRLLNKDALKDPRVKISAEDAFAKLRRSHSQYDAIYVDILYPFNIETSRLYSYEFFSLLARAMKPNGTMTILCPLDFEDRDLEKNRPIRRWMSSTLAKAGFKQLIQFSEINHSFLLGRREHLPIADPTSLQSLMEASLIADKSIWHRLAEWPLHYQPEYVNSLLRPQFVGVKDPFF